MDKYEIIAVCEHIAVLLDLQGENPFKVQAYQKAARSLESLDEDLELIVEEERLDKIPGIGKALAEKISILHKNGSLPYYNKLKRSVPKGLQKMVDIPGLGAKKVRALHEALGIKSIAQLKAACKKGDVANVKGFGTKTEENILSALQHLEEYTQRYLWWEADEIAQPIATELRRLKGVKQVEVCGSHRRRLETVGDLDFLVTAPKPEPVMDWFTTMPDVASVIAKGATKSSVRLSSGMQADLRVVPAKHYAFALHYFTGSKEHNIKLRSKAHGMGYVLSEWGIEAIEEGGKPLLKPTAKLTESDLFHALGLDYIPPELRQDMGEIEAAEAGTLPKLIEESDLRGTFHCHTHASDGKNSLEEMVAAAEAMGWDYFGIADHSKSSIQANGLDEERLMEQIESIRKLNKSKKFKTHVFAGTECDILAEGVLDFDNDILAELDYVVASIHRGFTQDEKTTTQRLIKAIENPHVTMIGHLTGRLLLRREPYAVNIPKVIDAAIANNTIIELNAHPWRLDMDWRHWHAAAEKGLLCAINPDAHSVSDLQYVRAGINVARKGWLTKQHVLNTRTLKQVKAYLG